MGNKIKIIFTSILLCASASVYAETLQYKLFTSNDDGVITRKNLISSMKNDVGVGIEFVNHSTNFEKINGQNFFILTNKSIEQLNLNGSAGISNIKGKNFFVGDLNIKYQPVKYFSSELTIFGDSIVSNKSTILTDLYGAALTFDLSNDFVGSSLSVKSARFNDSNTQTGYQAKFFISPIDGVAVFVKQKFYRNSLPFNNNYYSPDEYTRISTGISIRHKINDTKFSLNLENSKIKVIGFTENAPTYKFEIESKITKNVYSKIIIGKDMGSSSGFEYKFVEMGINILY